MVGGLCNDPQVKIVPEGRKNTGAETRKKVAKSHRGAALHGAEIQTPSRQSHHYFRKRSRVRKKK